LRRDELDAIWSELRIGSASQDGWWTRRILPHACCPIRAAFDPIGNRPALLFELAAEAIGRVVDYPSSEGFSLVPESLGPGHRGRVRLCLVLGNSHYRPHFGMLCEDVLQVIQHPRDEAALVDTLLGCLGSWQAFLRSHADGLSVEEQTGLFAELCFLLEVIHPLVPTATLPAWKGPLPGLWDFVLGDIAIEIKASTSLDGRTFQVANLAQLDAGAEGKLLLVMMFLAQASDGLSLVDMIDRARSRLANTPPERFQLDNLLLGYGYSEVHRQRYQARKLRVARKRYFRVSPGFPGLTPETVPRGVVQASYTVDSEACLSYELPELAALELIVANR
jgi:hypothetical protein